MADNERDFHRIADAQQREALTALSPLVSRYTHCALLDFPNHNNVGDNAIWLGEKECLRRLSIRIAYVCDLASYDADRLKKAVPPGGLILLHGGGNFGDYWPDHQLFRERIIESFPDRRIIQLPQSVQFERLEHLDRARRVMSQHRNLTILVRDRYSANFVKEQLDSCSRLCPDMAFFIGFQQRAQSPIHDVVWIAREDHESTGNVTLPETQLDVKKIDWILKEMGPRPWSLSPRLTVRTRTEIQSVFRNHLWLKRLGGRAFGWTFDQLARRRVARGLQMLSLGRVIITDRLHGHILATLLGLPQVLLENRYGKIRRYHESFPIESPRIRVTDSSEEALNLAKLLLSR